MNKTIDYPFTRVFRFSCTILLNHQSATGIHNTFLFISLLFLVFVCLSRAHLHMDGAARLVRGFGAHEGYRGGTAGQARGNSEEEDC